MSTSGDYRAEPTAPAGLLAAALPLTKVPEPVLLPGAHRAAATTKWLERIEALVLPTLTVLGFDLECAQHCGRLKAALGRAGTPIGDVDTQIAATALRHDLVVVTANAAHFGRVPRLQLETFTPGETGSTP